MTRQEDLDALQEALDILNQAGFELEVDKIRNNKEYVVGGTVQYTTLIKGDIILTQEIQEEEL